MKKGIDWEWQSMDGAMTKAPSGGKDWSESDRQGEIRHEEESSRRGQGGTHRRNRQRREHARQKARGAYLGEHAG